MSLPAIDTGPPRDDVIAEVRAIRAELAAQFGHDLDRLYAEAKRREKLSDRPRIPAAPKRLPTHSADTP